MTVEHLGRKDMRRHAADEEEHVPVCGAILLSVQVSSTFWPPCPFSSVPYPRRNALNVGSLICGVNILLDLLSAATVCTDDGNVLEATTE